LVENEPATMMSGLGRVATAATVAAAIVVKVWLDVVRPGGPWWGRGGPDWLSPAARTSPAAGDRHRGARWATSRDLRSLRVRRSGCDRLVLGRHGRVLLATEARHSVLVLGPTQSGKTSGFAVPAILEWPGPVVATSVKDDLVATTIRWRSQLGSCRVFDPTASSGVADRNRWTPLSEAGDWSGAQRMASWLVDATPARGGLSDAAFWFATAAKLLGPLLLAASRCGASMADVVRWTNTADYDEPGAVLVALGELEAATALEASAARDDRVRSSVGTTLETVLAPFEDPVVAAGTATSDIDVNGLLVGSGTLYLCGPSHEQARVQGLFAALVATVVAAAIRCANASGGSLEPPLLLVLDEAANIAPLRDLDTLASTGASLGIQLVTVCQDLAQLSTRYGPDRARTIANNHRAKVILSGVADLVTLDLLSGLAGEQAVREETITADLRDGRRTRSSATTFRRLIPPDELRRIAPNTGVLIYGHLPPARVALRPWYLDPWLRTKAQASP
jgi:type IV secretion system protein VirD4